MSHASLLSEKVKRLTPKGPVLRELYLKSGNVCAFPGCDARMMKADGDFIGQVCHIEAAEANGERFNPQQTDEQRRAFDNLLLLCYEHHVATNNVQAYPVERLREMKALHEAKFSDVAEKMRVSIQDHTKKDKVRSPQTLHRFMTVVGWSQYEGEDLASLLIF